MSTRRSQRTRNKIDLQDELSSTSHKSELTVDDDNNDDNYKEDDDIKDYKNNETMDISTDNENNEITKNINETNTSVVDNNPKPASDDTKDIDEPFILNKDDEDESEEELVADDSNDDEEEMELENNDSLQHNPDRKVQEKPIRVSKKQNENTENINEKITSVVDNATRLISSSPRKAKENVCYTNNETSSAGSDDRKENDETFSLNDDEDESEEELVIDDSNDDKDGMELEKSESIKHNPDNNAKEKPIQALTVKQRKRRKLPSSNTKGQKKQKVTNTNELKSSCSKKKDIGNRVSVSKETNDTSTYIYDLEQKIITMREEYDMKIKQMESQINKESKPKKSTAKKEEEYFIPSLVPSKIKKLLKGEPYCALIKNDTTAPYVLPFNVMNIVCHYCGEVFDKFRLAETHVTKHCKKKSERSLNEKICKVDSHQGKLYLNISDISSKIVCVCGFHKKIKQIDEHFRQCDYLQTFLALEKPVFQTRESTVNKSIPIVESFYQGTRLTLTKIDELEFETIKTTPKYQSMLDRYPNFH